MVPILRKNNETVFWKNNYPFSSRYCRTIKFEYKKKSEETILEEMSSLENQIKNLVSITFCIENCEITIKYTAMVTMINGKIRQMYTGIRSSQACSLCGVTPKKMNDLQYVAKIKVNIEAYQYGLPSLHTWIRNME